MKNLLKFDGLKKQGMHENLGKINISFKDEQTDNTIRCLCCDVKCSTAANTGTVFVSLSSMFIKSFQDNVSRFYSRCSKRKLSMYQ